jgi:WD40 repeat protein
MTSCIAITADGRNIARCSDGATVEIRCMHHSKTQKVFQHGHSDLLSCLAWSADGSKLASASCDATVRIWTCEGHWTGMTLRGHMDDVTCCSWSHSSRQLIATGSEDTCVRLWDAASGKAMHTFKGHEKTVNCLCFSKDDDSLLVSGADDNSVIIWDLPWCTTTPTKARGPRHIFLRHSSPVSCIAVADDGRTLASGCDDRRIYVWNRSGELLHVWKGHEAENKDCGCASFGTFMPSPTCAIQGHSAAVSALAFSPDGRVLASCQGCIQNESEWRPELFAVSLWDTATGTVTASVKGPTGVVQSIFFLPSGKHIVAALEDNGAMTLDVTDALRLGVEYGDTEGAVAHSLSRAPESQNMDATQQRVQDVIRRWHTVQDLVVSGDGTLLASCCGDVWYGPFFERIVYDHGIRVMDAHTGQTRQVLQGHDDAVTCLSFSHDSCVLASSSADASVRLWCMHDKSRVTVLQGHTATVNTVCWSPDSRVLASAGEDQTLRIWSEDGSCETCINLPSRRTCIAWSRGRLVAGTEDAHIQFWSISGELLGELKHLSHLRYGPEDMAFVGDLMACTFQIRSCVCISDLSPPGRVETLPGSIFAAMQSRRVPGSAEQDRPTHATIARDSAHYIVTGLNKELRVYKLRNPLAAAPSSSVTVSVHGGGEGASELVAQYHCPCYFSSICSVGNRIFVGCDDGQVRVCLRMHYAHNCDIQVVTLSHGQHVSAAGALSSWFRHFEQHRAAAFSRLRGTMIG